MTAHHAIANVAALVGEPTRAAMLLALLDGRALPAGELAREAGISPAATSLHLAKMTQGGLLRVHAEGRHRYYALASGEVAHAIESLGVVATRPPPRRADPARAVLREARTCYDHLAGVLAVGVAEVLRRDRLVVPAGERAFDVTPAGARWLADTLGVDVAALPHGKSPLARACLDWTERRPHLAGMLGRAMLRRFVELRWIAKTDTPRLLRVTTRGRLAFEEMGIRRHIS